MEKVHGRLRSLGLVGLILPIVLLGCPCTLALNPALDVRQYAHTTWKIRDGFTRGQITSIAQTRDGYLWLGTEFGLLRFDGVRNVPWLPPPGQQLPSDIIYSLLSARDGTLWIGTSKGLASWKDGKFTQYKELAGQYIFRIIEDHEGVIWADGNAVPFGKLCAIRNDDVQCYGEDGLLGRGATNLLEDDKGNLWVGVLGGLWRWRPGAPQFYSFPGEANGIQALGEDADGSLLFGWKEGIYRFSDGNAEKVALGGAVTQFRARRMLRDRDGALWVGTLDQGLLRIHQGRADAFLPSDGLSGQSIYALFEDREGNIWIATNNGLDRFREFAVATFTADQGLPRAFVGAILADRDGTAWISTYGGLSRWWNGRITTVVTGSAKRDGTLNGQTPNSLFQDSQGRVWISTNREVGFIESGRFVPIAGLPGGPVLGMAQTNDGSLWIANEQFGLFLVRPDKTTLHIPWATLGHKDHATVMVTDSSQRALWLGFHSGGVALFSDGKIRQSYSASDGLGQGRVNSLRIERDGTLWAATAGGLSRLKNERIVTLTTKNGLPCDTVHWVMEDDAHSLWLYTACGLVRIERSALTAWTTGVDRNNDSKRIIQTTVFENSDGVRILADAGHFSPQVAKTSDGKLLFNPWDGVSVIDPKHLPFNKLPPPVQIRQIIANRKTYAAPLDGIGDGKGRLSLPPLIRDLEFDYTALSLVAPEKVFFKYKLEGFDEDWQEAGNRRQAFYTNLPPKNYAFRVKACNNNGVWNETGTVLNFSVAPAYYQTGWFRLACVAAFLALLWALYQLRLRQLAREYHMRLEERVGERTRIARELHDSLLQGFQGLMFRLQAVRDLLPARASEAVKALDVALERGDKAILEGRDAVADLRESILGDNDIPRALTALGEELVLQNNDGATPPCVRVLVEGKQRKLDPELRDEIYRIAREALRNAFRHARAQKIETEITYSPLQFVLRVRDDGSGIDPAIANQGARTGHWGLPGMRERAEKFGGQLEVWSERGAGTEIALTIPASVAYAGFNRGSGIRLRWSKKMGQSKHEN